MNYIKSIILAVLFEGTVFVVDYLVLLLCMTVFRNIEDIDNIYYIQGGLLVLLDKILLFFAVIVIRKTVGNYSKDIIKDFEWLKFTFFPIYTICTICGMNFILGSPKLSNKNMIFFIIAFGLVGMNIVVYYLINDIMKRENEIHKNQIFRIQMRNQTNMYYSISENLENQRKKTHEYKNQMICIESLLKRNKINEMKKYIEQIGNGLKEELDSINTNHVVVDAILNTKYSEMMKKNIIFVFKINDLSGLILDDEDIVVILSNLLNNAIEACEKCKKKKMIKLKFVIEGSDIILSVRNTYENTLYIQNGVFLTTKSENDEHGIGIKNIVNVIERYGGSYVIKHDKETFFFSVMIPGIDKDLR